MAELVRHLRSPRLRHPGTPTRDDRRAKLVTPTARGHEVIAIAQESVPELEERVSSVLGADRVRALRHDLEVIRTAAKSNRSG